MRNSIDYLFNSLNGYSGLDIPLKLVITIHIDKSAQNIINYYKSKCPLNCNNRDKCSSLLLDYLVVYEIENSKVSDVFKFPITDITDFCIKFEYPSYYPREIFYEPDQSLKLVWRDEFRGNTLNKSLWTLLAHKNKCESK